ncbi:alternative ribosome rescue aminoacyl-tRNA hydrolase ArfB [Planktosalinus lacus]|uniref:Aminoacyl-tRNA hydrolase n=1 Tax=Planktosalinus lacus TaxID=1526573 RepID=A0A8J2Y8X5_9FLAO|nr:alternative ribosome rescue aminoacyl-tRNA hydrolase ArfB [Planktosalinus lacus]GGD96049.1 aminoacyl-tRNA hydrolase [Planktosalinus lacus]
MRTDILLNELTFKATRSSGAGGQHVNKVASRIELSFDIPNSQGLTKVEKERLEAKLASRLTKEGILLLSCSDSRSQHKNKAIAIERFLELIKENLKVKKARKKTKPSKSAIEKRLKSKKEKALKKANRKPPKIN